MNRVTVILLALFLSMPIAATGAPDVSIENARARLVIGADGVWKCITDKATGKDYAYTASPIPFASVSLAKKRHAAEALSRQGPELTVRFKDTPVTATYRIELTDDWILLKLQAVGGGEIDSIEFMRVPLTLTTNIGRKLNIAWDDQYSICLAATNMQTDCSASSTKDAAFLCARAWPQFGLSGAAVALLTCPTSEVKALLRKVSVAFDLLRNEATGPNGGVPSKDLPAARASYWFLAGITEKELDELIAYGKKAGIKQVMFSQGCWSKTTGHYLIREAAYPDGLAGLKKAVARLHSEGFLVGMHTFVSKVSKNDPYVTPVPDKRFWKDMEATLSADIDDKQTNIVATQALETWPASPLCKQKIWEGGVTRHMDAIIDDEIVQYEAIGPEGVNNAFLNCKRGAYGTKAAPHKAGAKIYHFGVDGCINGYIIDQETDLLSEVASRNAAVFNECGFDMVYFDGGEDIPRPHYWHYSAKFQSAAVSRYTKRPIIHMGTIMTHLVWHSFTRSGTVDTYLNTLNGAIISGAPVDNWPTVKEHIDASVRYLLRCEADMLPGELGWFGIWPKGKNTDGLQLDEAEYLMSKSLAHNAPISLETSFRQMESHPLTPAILEIVRTYEELRMSGAVDTETRTRLKEPGKDFALIQHEGRRHFVEMTPVPTVGGGREVRALVGELDGKPVATLWHYVREGEVRLPLQPNRARLLDFSGAEVPFAVQAGIMTLNATDKRYALICEGVTADQLMKAFQEAQVTSLPSLKIWVPARSFATRTGAMFLASAAGLKDEGALGDFVVCTDKIDREKPQDWYCEYTVDVPRKGSWSVWARLRYPTGDDMSFAFVPAGEPVSLAGLQVLGNSGQNQAKWHWDGQGGGSRDVPGQRARQLKLDKGPFTFRIYPREGPGTVQMNPRIDLICLCDDPGYVPNDEDAAKALAAER